MRGRSRWASLAVVAGTGSATLACLAAGLRGHPGALVAALVCAAVLVREVRARRRLDERRRDRA